MNNWLLAGLITVALALPPAQQSPYTEHTQRPIKALSEEQVAGYLAGEGMGYALAAELNDYPGPKHVLELATELQLSGQQEAQVTAAFTAMQADAQALGARLVDLERQLDEAFAQRSITEAELGERLVELGRVGGELRLAHLRAHLETTALLSAAQIQHYGVLRGYSDHGDHGEHQHHQ